MIAYFKHTDGESFTLNGIDYVGYFNITDGTPYTGQIYDSDSKILSQKSKFSTSVYMNKEEFDDSYGTNLKLTSTTNLNTFDILDKSKINTLLTQIENNNIYCYKNLLTPTPSIYNFEKNKSHFYALSSLSMENAIEMPAIDFYGNTENYYDTQYWSFLSKIVSGKFIVNTNEDFKYFCTDGGSLYILEGNFNNLSPLKIIYHKQNIPYYDNIYGIHIDEIKNELFLIKNEFIDIYDISKFSECNNLFLLDRIYLDGTTDTTFYIWNRTASSFSDSNFSWSANYSINNPNNPQYIKFGNRFRTQINDTSIPSILLKNKYSNDDKITINLSNFIDRLYDLDIRSSDDCLIVLGSKGYNILTLVIDTENYTPANVKIIQFRDQNKFNFDPTSKISFSLVDSNIFHIATNKDYQSRYISNGQFIHAKLKNYDFNYPIKYVWNTTNHTFNSLKTIKWNTPLIESNSYSNILVYEYVKNGKMYMLVHNNGRIYALHQSVSDRYINGESLNLDKEFELTECSSSSFGLYFNNNIYTIYRDTLNLYKEFDTSFTYTPDYAVRRNLTYSSNFNNDLYFNTNETISIIPILRITSNIEAMQTELLPNYIPIKELDIYIDPPPISPPDITPDTPDTPSTIYQEPALFYTDVFVPTNGAFVLERDSNVPGVTKIICYADDFGKYTGQVLYFPYKYNYTYYEQGYPRDIIVDILKSNDYRWSMREGWKLTLKDSVVNERGYSFDMFIKDSPYGNLVIRTYPEGEVQNYSNYNNIKYKNWINSNSSKLTNPAPYLQEMTGEYGYQTTTTLIASISISLTDSPETVIQKIYNALITGENLTISLVSYSNDGKTIEIPKSMPSAPLFVEYGGDELDFERFPYGTYQMLTYGTGIPIQFDGKSLIFRSSGTLYDDIKVTYDMLSKNHLMIVPSGYNSIINNSIATVTNISPYGILPAGYPTSPIGTGPYGYQSSVTTETSIIKTGSEGRSYQQTPMLSDFNYGNYIYNSAYIQQQYYIAPFYINGEGYTLASMNNGQFYLDFVQMYNYYVQNQTMGFQNVNKKTLSNRNDIADYLSKVFSAIYGFTTTVNGNVVTVTAQDKSEEASSRIEPYLVYGSPYISLFL